MSASISIVIPAHNAARYLAVTLDSIAAQGPLVKEILVVDDASTDGTPGLVEAEAAKRPGAGLRLIRLSENAGGPAKPRNEGIRAAACEYIALFDADDIMLPGKLSVEAAFLDAHPDIPFVFTNFQNFDDKGTDYPPFLSDHRDFQNMEKAAMGGRAFRLKAQTAYEVLLADTYIGTSSVMFRKPVFDEVGGFDESLSNSDDVDWFFRVARAHDIGYIDEVWHKRRIHGQNISSRQKAFMARLSVYKRQLPVAKSRWAQTELRRFIAQICFSIGYLRRRDGRGFDAFRSYAASLRYDPSNFGTYAALLKSWLPVREEARR